MTDVMTSHSKDWGQTGAAVTNVMTPHTKDWGQTGAVTHVMTDRCCSDKYT